MEIVGIKRSKWTPKDGGNEIAGYNLYLCYEHDDVEGMATDRIFVSDKKLQGYVPKVGDYVRVLYNRWGKVDLIEQLKM